MRCFATRASLTACLQPASFLLSGVHIAFSERRFRIARPSTLFRSSLRACDSVPSGASAFFFIQPAHYLAVHRTVVLFCSLHGCGAESHGQMRESHRIRLTRRVCFGESSYICCTD